RLSLNDIEDLYVLKVQGKLHHLGGQVKYDMVKSLLIFIRSEVIKKIVEDIQLDPYGVIYTNRNGGNQFLGISKVFKFCDGTLRKVHEELKVMLNINEVGYIHGRLNGCEWTVRDIKRSRRMFKEIVRILKARAQMRRLESYVDGQPKTDDIRLFRLHTQETEDTGKVCILTNHLDIIRETVSIPVDNEHILVRVYEFDEDIDSLFNGYLCESSSDDDDDDKSVNDDKENNLNTSGEDDELSGSDDESTQSRKDDDDNDDCGGKIKVDDV
ncbi:hypothetical protein Tco_1140001, partial [Tanacetum coccineum]